LTKRIANLVRGIEYGLSIGLMFATAQRRYETAGGNAYARRPESIILTDRFERARG